MKKFNTTYLIKSIFMFAAVFIAASCVSDEPLNAECDIVTVILPDEVLLRQPQIENDKVILYLKSNVSVADLAPEFVLTPGATIEPPSGTVRDFTSPQTYTVTSEDREWSKNYIIRVSGGYVPGEKPDDPTPPEEFLKYLYSFEHVKAVESNGGKTVYDQFIEVNEAGEETMAWASSNPGFRLTGMGSASNTFPVYQSDGGVNGKCATLVTRSTGSFGALAKKPMAAGSLFIGVFDVTNAMSNPLGATHFGTLFTQEPVTLSGQYKYIPGETYCEPDAKGKLVPVEGKTDMFNIYGVLFEVTDDMQYLDGTNVLAEDNPNIISTAIIDNRHATNEWTSFNIPFVLRPGKTIDHEKLKNGGYSFTIVMSSSEGGDFFRGAVGSTLYVDELEVTCVSENE